MTSAAPHNVAFLHAMGTALCSGATESRVGPFEQASGGTVFLEEIGELPVDLQPKPLRALETRQIRRVGENTPPVRSTRAWWRQPTATSSAKSKQEGKRRWIEQYEREYLSQMLTRCKANISELARASGLSRQSCHGLLDRYGLV